MINIIKDNSNITFTLSKYYQFITKGANQTEVVWTEPYEDSYGLGRMTTAAFPVYQRNANNNTKILLGVVGLDVLMSDFTIFDTSEFVVDELVKRSRGNCLKISPNYCELENMRGIILKNFLYLNK